MPKMPHAGEHHRQPLFVARRDRFGVADGAAGLDARVAALGGTTGLTKSAMLHRRNIGRISLTQAKVELGLSLERPRAATPNIVAIPWAWLGSRCTRAAFVAR